MRLAVMTAMLSLMLTACASTKAGTPWTDNFNQQRNSSVVQSARSFIIKRQGCDHFRGEPPFDEQRKQFLIAQIKELCTGTDAKLQRLRAKYANQPETMKALSEFEDCVEFDTVCAEKD